MKELEEARAALARGEYKQATEACTRAIERAPENLEARIVLVELCLACQRIDDALTVGEYILSQAGKAAEALQEAQREELQEAFAPYGRYASQRLAQRFPRVLAFLRARGILPAVETEMQEETAAQCETETRRKTETHHETERLAAAVSPRQEADAQEYLSSLPPAARIQSLRAEAGNYLVQGDAAAADTCLRQALFLDGKDDATLRARAIALWAMGRTQEALAAAGKCSLTDFSLLAKLQQTPPASAKDKAKNQEQQGKRKKLLVFLPVDASMWDSLDSVWRAAAADPEHCRTLVIPLPFSDRNPDYSETVWQCDAAAYPDDVPVEDWHDYPMERLMAMHPDVIFINIPYDDCNYVYSVDAQYYSRNLKYCTDNLVYIPYFVMGDTIPVNFCQVPAVIHADHVIVQDENIKRQYEQNYPDGEPPEGKFLALGSPKFDHVLRAREEFTLPAAWQRIIKGRKVILYNTSVTSALTNTAYVCRKLRSVLAYFKNRKDIAFWWRPHPFMEATLRSMRPSILQEYIAIRKQYQEEAWGIYDDTSDLDRAIVCSDAYYGDMSSVVWLYRATGKAVMIEDYREGEEHYWFASALFDSNSGIAFILPGQPYLMKLQRTNGEIKVIDTLPMKYCNKESYRKNPQLYSMLARVKDGILLLPHMAQVPILFYEKKSRRFFEIDRDDMSWKGILTRKNQTIDCDTIHYKRYSFIIGMDRILRYDETKHKIKLMRSYLPYMKKYMKSDIHHLLVYGCIYREKLLVPYAQADVVFLINPESDETEIYHLHTKMGGWIGSLVIGDDVWLLPASVDGILRWNPLSKEERFYPLAKDGIHRYEMGKWPYRGLFFYRGKIVVVPCDGKKEMLLFDPKTHQRTVLWEEEILQFTYAFSKKDQGKYLLLRNKKKETTLVVMEENCVQEHTIHLPDDLKQKIKKYHQQVGEGIFYESEMSFSQFICMGKQEKEASVRCAGFGRKIYQKVFI